MALEYRPKINDCVVVMRDGKVVGTIRRYAAQKACIVSVPGLLSASMAIGKGNACFRTINEAKGVLTKLEAQREKNLKKQA